jgi:hypothetical protein
VRNRHISAGNRLCGRWFPGCIENANFRCGEPVSEGILIELTASEFPNNCSEPNGTALPSGYGIKDQHFGYLW